MAGTGKRRGGAFSLVIVAACVAAAITAMMVSTAFLSLSLYFYLETLAGPSGAALLVAIFGVFFTLFMALVAMLLPKPSILGLILPSESELFGRLAEAVEIGRSLGDEARQLMQSKMGKPALGALALGLVLGISPTLRRLLSSVVRTR